MGVAFELKHIVNLIITITFILTFFHPCTQATRQSTLVKKMGVVGIFLLLRALKNIWLRLQIVGFGFILTMSVIMETKE